MFAPGGAGLGRAFRRPVGAAASLPDHALGACLCVCWYVGIVHIYIYMYTCIYIYIYIYTCVMLIVPWLSMCV